MDRGNIIFQFGPFGAKCSSCRPEYDVLVWAGHFDHMQRCREYTAATACVVRKGSLKTVIDRQASESCRNHLWNLKQLKRMFPPLPLPRGPHAGHRHAEPETLGEELKFSAGLERESFMVPGTLLPLVPACHIFNKGTGCLYTPPCSIFMTRTYFFHSTSKAKALWCFKHPACAAGEEGMGASTATCQSTRCKDTMFDIFLAIYHSTSLIRRAWDVSRQPVPSN